MFANKKILHQVTIFKIMDNCACKNVYYKELIKNS